MQLEGAIAVEAGRERLRPGDRGDLAMPERHEMRRGCGGCRPSSSCTTEEKRGSSVWRADRHDRQCRRSGATPPSSPRDAREDQPVDAARPHGLDDALLAPRVAVGIGEDGDIVVPRQAVLDAADDRRKGRIGDVRHDDADRAGAQRCCSEEAAAFGRYPAACSPARIFRLKQRRDTGCAESRIERARNRRDMDADLRGRCPSGSSRALVRSLAHLLAAAFSNG